MQHLLVHLCWKHTTPSGIFKAFSNTQPVQGILSLTVLTASSNVEPHFHFDFSPIIPFYLVRLSRLMSHHFGCFYIEGIYSNNLVCHIAHITF